MMVLNKMEQNASPKSNSIKDWTNEEDEGTSAALLSAKVLDDGTNNKYKINESGCTCCWNHLGGVSQYPCWERILFASPSKVNC